jgi:hypothetical protein
MSSRFNTLRKFVATNKDNRFISYCANASRIILDLVDNARHWNFETNGEQFVCTEVLYVARLMLEAAVADELLLVAAFDLGEALKKAFINTNDGEPKSIGLAFYASRCQPAVPHLAMIGMGLLDDVQKSAGVGTRVIDLRVDDHSVGAALGADLMMRKARDGGELTMIFVSQSRSAVPDRFIQFRAIPAC